MIDIDIKELEKYLKSLYDAGVLNQKEYETKIDSLFNIFQKKQPTKKLSDQKPVVEITNLTKHYPRREKPAINNISFNIYPGQFHAFIGANGAGKTTAIKSMIGAYSHYNIKGSIKIDGYSNYTVKAKQAIGYIPEYAKFPKKVKTRDYLALMSMLSGYKYRDSLKLADQLLLKMNMSKFAHKSPESFSSGQKKKILLAQALIHNPSILIMDEPAANLDPMARDELFSILVQLQHEGKAIFLSSHILDEMNRYATYATILDGGQIVFDGPLAPNTDLSLLYKHYVKKGSVDN